MALIHCSECGREISDRASSCPGCGAPVRAVSEAVPPSLPAASPIMGVVAFGAGLAGVVMPYFAAVFLVPIAFVCGVIAFSRGQRGLGCAGIALAVLGLIGIISVSQHLKSLR
jgi:hypothetical protein